MWLSILVIGIIVDIGPVMVQFCGALAEASKPGFNTKLAASNLLQNNGQIIKPNIIGKYLIDLFIPFIFSFYVCFSRFQSTKLIKGLIVAVI
jgi:hypothetical protein